MKLCSRTWCAAFAVALASVALQPSRAAAQQGTGVVRGTVTDSTSQRGVPGVQVVIRGTTNGTVTNDAGQYTIRGVQPGEVVVRAQRIGFAPAERGATVVANGTAVADIALRPVAVQLSEVVTVGYGTASRQDVSSAVASVRAEEFANTPVAGVDAALQGKIPGVQVVQNAGNPGNGISLRIRGPASLNAGNQPLYVVDGVPILQENYTQLGLGGQDITAVTGLNPDEIASIDVLKDAAAAAIYGSRGSNGVVLITTKRGSAGKTKLTLNAYTGTQSVEKRIGLLNAKQYVEVMNEGAKNDGYDPEDYDFVAGTDDAKSYDWQDAVFRSAPVRDVQLGASGGSDRTQFFLSGSLFDQKGIVIGSGYQRQAGRLNLDFRATDRLSVRTSVALTREDNDRVEGDGSSYGVLTNAIGMQPMRPIRGESSGYGGDNEDLNYSNPVAMALMNPTNLKTLRALGNVEARYSLFGDRVSISGRAGMDVLSLDEQQWQSPLVDGTYAATNGGVGKAGHTNASKYVLESFATVNALATESQRLSLVAGASSERNRSELTFLRGERFPNGFRTYLRNASVLASWDGAPNENTLVSYFSRANYSLLDRYLLSASLRVDGSSRFGAENRYGVFPAISAGWVVSDEGFARGLKDFATLKLRASFGMTGNQGIGDYASRTLTAGSAAYSGIPGSAPSALGNASLRWETTREFDGGVDYSMFDGRLSVIADYYVRRTSDLLVRRPIASVSGYSSVWSNVGDIKNEGVDLGLRTENLRPADAYGIGWTTDLNVTWNRNRVTSLNGQEIIDGINGRQTSIVRVGQPMGAFYMFKFEGVDPETGEAILSDGPEVVGSPHPKYYGGLTNTFTYRNLDLRTFLQFSKGNQVFNMMRIFTDDGGCSYDNKSTISLRRWQKPGDKTDVPRMSYDCDSGADAISSRFIEDGSYLRLGEVTLGYRLPTQWAAAARLNEARLYVSGRNLHTWTKYSGYNPDVNSAGSDANVVQGTDYYAYPLARTFTVGVSAGW